MAERHDRKRLEIKTLYQNTSLSLTEIGRRLNVDKSTVSRVVKQLRESGTFETQYSNCGRKPILNERDHRRIRQTCVKNPRYSAHDIVEEVGAECSDRTMRRVLNEIGCKAHKPERRPFINTSQMEKRRRWALQHLDWTVDDWKRVIFSDETIIEIRDDCPQYVRIVDGHELVPEHFIRTTKHPTSVMIWACFGWKGTGRCHVIERRMNSECYINEIVGRRV